MWLPGIKRSPPAWEVTLWGKHRSFGDYISCGVDNPVVQRFAGWAQRGKTLYAIARHVKSNRLISWRYWLKEGNRRFHCGVMTTECDRSGRPSLLILAGRFQVSGDPGRWESFSLSCGRTWQAMTAVGREEFTNLPDLQARLTSLPRPENEFSVGFSDGGRASEAVMAAVRQAIQTDRKRCLTDKTVIIESADNSEDDLLGHQIACRRILKTVPDSLFMGGLPEKTRLLFFFRRFGENDFMQLWEGGTD